MRARRSSRSQSSIPLAARCRCTSYDATIINAPSSTKNAAKARDAEMHQTKKGNQWYFGMKAHLGVDSRTKLIHAVVATSANVAGPGSCLNCCMASKPVSGAIRPIAVSAPRSARKRRGRRISPTAAIVTAASPTRWSAPRTAANRRCGPKSRIRSELSSACSASPRCATVGSRRTSMPDRDLRLGHLFIVRRQLLRLVEA